MGATLLHKPTAPSEMEPLVCVLTAAPVHTGMNTDSRALA